MVLTINYLFFSQAGVLSTLMSISQKVMTDCLSVSNTRRTSEASDSVFEHKDDYLKKTPLESQILHDWLSEATHQLTRPSANNTVRVAADNLLIIIASKHNCFDEVISNILCNLPND